MAFILSWPKWLLFWMNIHQTTTRIQTYQYHYAITTDVVSLNLNQSKVYNIMW